MHGFILLPTPGAIRAAWEQHLQSRRWPGFWKNRIGDDWNLREYRDGTADEPLQAYISAGRWVADCPCGCGVAGWPEHEFGCCYECGTVWRVAYPPAGEVERAVAALAVRPARVLMHWLPGESAGDLELENLAHGLPRVVS